MFLIGHAYLFGKLTYLQSNVITEAVQTTIIYLSEFSNQVLMQWGILLDRTGLFTFPTAFLNTYSVLFAPCTTVKNSGTVGELTGCVYNKTLTDVQVYVNLPSSKFKDNEIFAIGY